MVAPKYTSSNSSSVITFTFGIITPEKGMMLLNSPAIGQIVSLQFLYKVDIGIK